MLAKKALKFSQAAVAAVAFAIIAASITFIDTAYGATIVVPDDFKTIQAAVDGAKAGDVVEIKSPQNNENTYTENVVIKKPLTLKAQADKPSPVIKAADKSISTLKIIKTNDIEINGITFVGSSISGIFVQDSERVALTNNVSTKNGIGITLQRSKEIIVTGNQTVFNENYGIYLDGVKSSKLTNNTANSNNDKGIFVNNSQDNVISDNNANLNMWNGITLYSSNRNVIKNNMTLRNTFGVVISDSNEIEEVNNTSLPNIYIVYPIILVYLGILSYLVQKNIFKALNRAKKV